MDEQPDKQDGFDEERLANGQTPEEWTREHEEEIRRAAKHLRSEVDPHAKREWMKDHTSLPSEDEVIDGISYFLMWIGYWTAIGFALVGDHKDAIMVGIYASIVRLIAIGVVNLMRHLQP